MSLFRVVFTIFVYFWGVYCSSYPETGHNHPNLAKIESETISNTVHFQNVNSFGATYYVAKTGSDDNSGTIDSPLLTLDGARNKLRSLNGKLPDGGVLVYIREGVYMNNITNYKSPLLTLFGKQDSGSRTKPIVYSGYPNENVKISGGLNIDSKYFQLSNDNKYMTADLTKAFGTANFDLGTMQTQTLGLCNNYKSVLYLNNARMDLARWPNIEHYYDQYTEQYMKRWEFTNIMRVVNPTTTFVYNDSEISSERANNWKTAVDDHQNDNNKPWIHGYWQYDWADNYVEVKDVNVQKNEIVSEKNNLDCYSYNPGVHSRYYITNILSELDTTNEYWIDIKNKLVYISKDLHSTLDSNNFYLSFAPKIFDISNVSYVSIMNLTFSYSTMSGLYVNNSDNVVIANLNGFGHNQYGMEVSGNNNTVYKNTMNSIGCVGISINGGNIYKLERGNNMVLSNNVTEHSEFKRTYQPGIAFGTLKVDGADTADGYPSPDRLHANGDSVGNNFIGNYIAFGPHHGMYGFCNDNLFQYNTFERMVFETTDSGAWYSHFGWTHRGSVFDSNLFQYIYNLAPLPTNVYLQEGIYLDDEASGYTVINNTFIRTRIGLYMGGGRSNIANFNKFANNQLSISLPPDGLTWEQDACNKGGEFEIELDQVNWQQPPWSTHYGQTFVNIYSEKPCTPIYVNISYNEYCYPKDNMWANPKFFDQSEHTMNSWGSYYAENTENNWNKNYC